MSESVLQIEKLFQAFGDPEYRFLLFEPLIFLGITFGLVMFIVGFFLKATKLQSAALIIVGVSALTHIPYLNARITAQPRMEQVYKIKSPSRVREFNNNTITWREDSWKYLTLAALACFTLAVGCHRNRLGLSLAIATVLFALIGVKSSLWLHYKDSLAFHPNLKTHDAPIDSLKKYSVPPKRPDTPITPFKYPGTTTTPRTSVTQSTRISKPSVPKLTTLSSPVRQTPKPRRVVPIKD